MSTGYGWEGIRHVFATLLRVRHVPERLCGSSMRLYTCMERYKCSTFTFTFRKLNSTVASSAGRLRRDIVTLTFDLLTPKPNRFIVVPRCTNDKSLSKIQQVHNCDKTLL